MAVPVENALAAAQAHALRRLAVAAPAGERPRLEALADSLAARSERRSAALPLAAYAGTFGERRIAVEGERLFYQRDTRPREALVPLGGNRFVFESDPGTVVEFMPSGTRVAAITVGSAGGPIQGRYERTQ
jgi:hypothetical protein